MTFLPPYLLNAWRLQHGADAEAKSAEELKGWTVSSLSEFFIRHQLEKSHGTPGSDHRVNTSSLTSLATGKILDELQTSEDPLTDIETLAANLNTSTLRQLLQDPRTPYQVLRAFDALPQTSIGHDRKTVDVDEAILRNEHYIRSRGLENRDDKYLVTLETLCQIVSKGRTDNKSVKSTRSTEKKLVSIIRKDPPKGGLEVLDHRRPRELKFNPNATIFGQVFERITNGILRGLDWSNVMVAGGMALMTLLHTDPSNDQLRSIQNPDIDLYIYGLEPKDANRKAEEIHDIWIQNMPVTAAGAAKRLVVKNAKTINLLASYPNRRIQIVLKLLPSPTDVLLNFDLDACAIGYDGSRVIMLPRCARAIETGYSVFTMDLVWGHHLGDRRASQDSRIFKYADRGFGVRFLPSYVRSLEEADIEQEVLYKSTVAISSEERSEADRYFEYERWTQRDRKPTGKEPGLKTLRRIAYLGRDYVHRFYFGSTPLCISPQRMQKQLGSQGFHNVVHGDGFKPGYGVTGGDLNELIDNGAVTDTDDSSTSENDIETSWRNLYIATELQNRMIREANDERRVNDQGCAGPLIKLSDLDTEALHTGLPDGRRGLGNLEIFMRHCEAWRLHSRADATLDMDSTASLAYDPETYDDLPSYEWGMKFDIDVFARTIDGYNNELWSDMKAAICGKLGVPPRMSGFADYSTRRIRRQVAGPDFKTIQEKQITIPMCLPFGIENHLTTTLPQNYDDIPSHFTNFRPLVPVHDFTKYHGPLPSLHDTAAETGNLRYWVITKENMWASQHRVLDEISELLWVFFHWFVEAMRSGPDGNIDVLEDGPASCWRFARSFRRRLILPDVPSDQAGSAGLPSLRERLLFRPWAFTSPRKPDREYSDLEIQNPSHELFDEEAVLYPFPDKLFWDPDDEGTWNEGGVPAWVEVPSEEGTRKDSKKGIYSYTT